MIIDVDISGAIKRMSDRERYELLLEVLNTIKEEGTIGRIRILVSSTNYDDQPPMVKP